MDKEPSSLDWLMGIFLSIVLIGYGAAIAMEVLG